VDCREQVSASIIFAGKCITIHLPLKVILARYTYYRLWRTGIWMTDGGTDITDLCDDTKCNTCVSALLVSDW
jgi:hypothetical protein